MAGFPTNVSGLFGGGGDSGGGGSSSGHMVPFLAGMGFRHFADTIKKLHSTVSGGGGQDSSKNPNIGPGQTAGQPMSGAAGGGAAAQSGGGAAGMMPWMQRPQGPLNPMTLARLAGLFPGAGASGATGGGSAGAAPQGVVPGGIAALLGLL